MKEWLCPNCKRTIKAEDMDASRISIIGVTGQMSCKFCGHAPLIEFNKIEGKNFEKTVAEFHKRTGL
jgi:uncharacterized radical SAM superfamily protein